MVTGGDEADVVFPGAVESLLGSLATEVQIDTGQNGLIDVTLATTSAPADAADHGAAFDQQRLTPHHLLDAASEIPGHHRLAE
ncbi:hypothetical protein D3C76_1655270 [compost metagenome]